MGLTRKHFEKFASIIKARFDANDAARARRGHEGDYQVGFDAGLVAATENIALELADYCATMNPNFDRERFLKACGL